MVAAGLGEADQQQLIGSTSLSDGLLAVDAGVNGSGLPGEADEVSAGDAGTVRTGSTGGSEVQSLPHPLSPPSTTPNPVPVASTSTSTPSSSSSKPSPTPVLASPAPRKIALLRRPSVSAGAEKEAPEPAERNGVDEVARHAAKLSLSVATDAPSTDELDAGDDEQPPLDKVLRDGLQNPRDRLLLLRAEVEMERFVANSSVTRLPLAPPHFQPGLNSYQRLLIHRLADMFGITREVEAAPPTMWNAGIINPATGQPQGVVVLVKGEATTIPPHKLASYVPAPDPVPSASPATPVVATPNNGSARPASPAPSATDSITAASSSSAPPTPAPLPVFKILPRANASRTASSASSSVVGEEDGGSSASGGTNAKGKGRRDLTLEEREAAYKEARDRIFNAPEADRSTIASISAASSVAGEDSASVQLLGVGITRPSSAGSTFSRSSAALSVSGSRPPPSIASESSLSIRSGYLGYYQPPPSFQVPSGPYGGAPSLRPSAPSFDPATGTWTYGQPQPEYTYGGRPGYAQPGPAAQIPPPPPPPAPYGYPPANPAYAAQQSIYGDGLPHPPPPQQPPSAWSRGLPSPALSSSSGGSFPPQSFYLSALSQPLQQTPPATTSNDSGYLMRFPEGAVVTPGGSVVGPPTPFSSVVSTGGASLRSGSSLSLASSASRGTRGATAGSSGPPSLRRLSQSTTHSIGSVSAVSSAPVSEDAASRRSPSNAEDASPETSLGGRSEEGSSRTGASTPASEGRRRDRQPTIVGERPAATEGDEGAKGKTVLHPSLPPKPAWVATRPPPERTAPAASTSPSHVKSSQPLPPPPPPSTYSSQSATQRPPLSFAAAAAPASAHPPAYPPVPPPPVPGAWNAAAGQVSHPLGAGMPSFANPGEYPALGQQPSSRTIIAPPPPPPQPYYPPQGPPTSAYPSWPSHAANGPPPAHPGLPHVPNQPFADDLMNMPDIRRPPPKSTQLFDPSKPLGGSGSMRRGGSGAGHGGVVVGSPVEAISRAEKLWNLPKHWINAAITAMGDDGPFQRFERGEMGQDEFYREFGARLGDVETNNRAYRVYCKRAGIECPPLPQKVQIDGKELWGLMMDPATEPDPVVVEAINRLRASQRYKVAALTNNFAPAGTTPTRHISTTPYRPISTSELRAALKEVAQGGEGEAKGTASEMMKGLFDAYIESCVEGLRKPDPKSFRLALDILGVEAHETVFLDDIGHNLAAAKKLGIKTIRVKHGKSKEAIRELEETLGMDLTSGKEAKL
ncbi:hypothetical protein NBRC10512v2_000608 [Rhodotorula toruloides]